jgi:methyltransferase-like protein
LDSATAEAFVAGNEVGLTSDKPIARAALRALGDAWPRSLPVRELCTLAEQRSGQLGEENQRVLLATLLRGAAANLVELDSVPPRVAATVSEHPRASRLARIQARSAHPVTNLWHRSFPLDSASCHLLTLLDGKHTHGELVEGMVAYFARLPMAQHPTAKDISHELAKILAGFSRSALLEA